MEITTNRALLSARLNFLLFQIVDGIILPTLILFDIYYLSKLAIINKTEQWEFKNFQKFILK